MSSLHSVVAVLRGIQAEPPSVMRLEYLLYLCDWYHTLLHRKRLVDADWLVTPISLLPKLAPHQRSSLETRCEASADDQALQVMQYVTGKTQSMMLNDLLGVVRGSFPLTRPTIYSAVDLISCADAYHAMAASNADCASVTAATVIQQKQANQRWHANA